MTTSATPQKSNFADNVDTYQAALMSLFSGKPEDTEADLSKLLSPTFTQRDDDTTRDFDGFVKHMRWLREMAPEVNLTVVQFLRDGPDLAERHTSTFTPPGGRVMHAETYQFVKVAEDGRLEWIVETVQRKQ